MTVSRRTALAFLGLGAAPALAPNLAPNRAQAQEAHAAFLHGVASGDPLADRVIIWTRATPAAPGSGRITLHWTVAEDAAFTRIAASGQAATGPERDYTVKVDVTGLKPGRDYWYRFAAGAETSPVGRMRTLPVGRLERLTLAFVTCSLYSNGYFNAYDHIARSEHLDAVVELGDYIYEYGAAADDYGMDNGRKLGRIPEPAHDLVTLADYRTRYAQYRRDADLQAAHARAPWICVWDDHEVCNDSWKGGGENHHDKTEGAFDDRKAAALQAYFEWLPIREPQASRPLEQIWRSFDFGDLASLTMLETRLTARSYQLEYDRPGDIPFIVYDASDPAARRPVRDAATLARIKAATGPDGAPPKPYVIGPDVEAIEAFVRDAGRTMMGPQQEAWLKDTLARSVAAGRPWQVIGNEVIMGRARSPKIEPLLGAEGIRRLLSTLPPALGQEVARQIDIASYDQPFDLDGWDGYPAARARFDAMVAGLPGGNTIVVSGDSHAFWTNQLHDAAGAQRLALEFGTSAISSPSLGDGAGGFQLGEVFMRQNPEVTFCDQLAKGYVRLELTHQGAVADMVAVQIDRKPYASRILARWSLAPTPGPGVAEVQRLPSPA
jgi:alkaline phosphatase D